MEAASAGLEPAGEGRVQGVDFQCIIHEIRVYLSCNTLKNKPLEAKPLTFSQLRHTSSAVELNIILIIFVSLHFYIIMYARSTKCCYLCKFRLFEMLKLSLCVVLLVKPVKKC